MKTLQLPKNRMIHRVKQKECHKQVIDDILTTWEAYYQHKINTLRETLARFPELSSPHRMIMWLRLMQQYPNSQVAEQLRAKQQLDGSEGPAW